MSIWFLDVLSEGPFINTMVDYYHQPANSYNQPGYDYTQQEEEWDREGLLDPAWEKQQKKVFRVTFISYQLNLNSCKRLEKPHGSASLSPAAHMFAQNKGSFRSYNFTAKIESLLCTWQFLRASTTRWFFNRLQKRPQDYQGF